MRIALEATMIHQDSSKVNFITELDDIDSLVRLYRPRILRYVTFSIGDQDLAETITQDCFLKAYNARSSFRGDCAVSTWLFSIANNLIRDQLRTKKFQFWHKAKATSVDITEMASILPSGASSPEAGLLAKERAKQVAEAVEKLSENQRKVFILKFSEELDIAEIALATGMPVNTVKTHLHRAVNVIRTNLGARA
jgi:RNA polymerase sigma-70 factor (ECF subfamily)